MAQGRVTHQTSSMADAIVLLAVVSLAIAALADILLEKLFLLGTGLDSRLTVIVQTVTALADPWQAADALLKAHTVELTAHTTLAVASLQFWLLSCGLRVSLASLNLCILGLRSLYFLGVLGV